MARTPEQVLRRVFWKLLFRGRAAHPMRAHRRMKQVSLALTIFLYAVFGILPATMAWTVDSLTYASLLHGFTLTFASLTLASSAGTMLFMREESEILLHRPVTPQALLRAKVFVLVSFALILAFSLNLAGLAAGAWGRSGGWRFIPAHSVTTVLLMIFAAASIVLLYNLCLKFWGREKFDNLLAVLQTMLVMALMFSGQVLPRLFRLDAVRGWNLAEGWTVALPPVWFGGLDALLCGARPVPEVWLPASLAIGVTGVTAWLAFGKLSSAYGEGLLALNESRDAAPAGPAGKRGRLLAGLVHSPPLCWWLRHPVERHAFLLVSAYMVRDREVKLKLYPGLVPMLIMPVTLLFGMSGVNHTGAELWVQAFAACYLAVIPFQALLLLSRSEHWRAAGCFRAAPLPHWAPLFHGARKAVLGWLTYPVLLLQAAAFAALQGSVMPLVMALPALLFLPVASLVPGLVKPWLPLSVPAEEQHDSTAGCLFMAVMMALSAGIGGCAMWLWQQGALWFWIFLAGEALLMLAASALLNRLMRAIPWHPAEGEASGN